MSNKEQLSRRDFFRRGVKSAIQASDRRSLELAKLWFRPPFALEEIEFLDRCSKCGKCAEVCPTGVLRLLPEKYGLRAMNTPVLDLINKACILCEDWPCVTVCEPGALFWPEPEINPETSPEDVEAEIGDDDIPLPPMALAAIDQQACIPFSGPECGACAHTCPVEGALIWEGSKPFVASDKCVGCGLCRQACIVDPKAIAMLHVERNSDASGIAQEEEC